MNGVGYYRTSHVRKLHRGVLQSIETVQNLWENWMEYYRLRYCMCAPLLTVRMYVTRQFGAMTRTGSSLTNFFTQEDLCGSLMLRKVFLCTSQILKLKPDKLVSIAASQSLPLITSSSLTHELYAIARRRSFVRHRLQSWYIVPTTHCWP